MAALRHRDPRRAEKIRRQDGINFLCVLDCVYRRKMREIAANVENAPVVIIRLDGDGQVKGTRMGRERERPSLMPSHKRRRDLEGRAGIEEADPTEGGEQEAHGREERQPVRVRSLRGTGGGGGFAQVETMAMSCSSQSERRGKD